MNINGYVCDHGMSDQAEGHQDCDRPNRIERDKQSRPSSYREERTDRNGLTVRDVHLCAHGHEAHVTGHEQCERLNGDLPHLHFETDTTPHQPRQRPTQAILRTLRRITNPHRHHQQG